MNRIALLVSIALIFLPVGYAGRGLIEARLDAAAAPDDGAGRAAVALYLFRTYCAPMQSRRYFGKPRGLVRYDLDPGKLRWVEPVSRLVLEYTWYSCSVSDAPRFFDDTERQAVEDGFRAEVGRDFPGLKPDDRRNLPDWARILLWAEYPVGDGRRWAVMLSRTSDTGPESGTFLRLLLPAGRYILAPDYYPG